ncbi:MAG: hypothetical protein KKD69_02570 [Euryarchaeota archaeon]|nr:hypothetical protein [Euryarchaeota archaeon]
MKAFEFIETPGALEDINLILQDFDENHDEWQVGFNGRSGGYIVLYKGFKELDTHTKTICNHCGIRTGYAEEMPCKVSGCSGTLKKINRPVYRIGVPLLKRSKKVSNIKDLNYIQRGAIECLCKIC